MLWLCQEQSHLLWTGCNWLNKVQFVSRRLEDFKWAFIFYIEIRQIKILFKILPTFLISFITTTFLSDIGDSLFNRHEVEAEECYSNPCRWKCVSFSGMPRQALELFQPPTMNYSVSNENSCSWRNLRVWNADCRLRYKHEIRGKVMFLQNSK